MIENVTWDVCVIGGGPAGLAAAEMAAADGARVVIVDHKPSLGRKFLMAGKSGLNLTMDMAADPFYASVTGADRLANAIADFGPAQVIAWAQALDQDIFTGSSGRVFPKAMKASPLLRAWLARLDGLGVSRRVRWRWTGWRGADLTFLTPDGPQDLRARAVVLALGGGSWARLGSDGAWVATLPGATRPFEPANCGFQVAWSAYMARHFGAAIKSVRLGLDDTAVQGEFVITAKGIEGSGIYTLAAITNRRMFDGPVQITLDLFPDLSADRLAARLSKPRGKASLSTHLRKTLGLTGARLALTQETGLPGDLSDLPGFLKAVPLSLTGPSPLDEAISTVGGVDLSVLTSDLMLRDRPGVFCAGEMLDWDAPTGGYLITTCLATGRHAGKGALRWVRDQN